MISSPAASTGINAPPGTPNILGFYEQLIRICGLVHLKSFWKVVSIRTNHGHIIPNTSEIHIRELLVHGIVVSLIVFIALPLYFSCCLN